DVYIGFLSVIIAVLANTPNLKEDLKVLFSNKPEKFEFKNNRQDRKVGQKRRFLVMLQFLPLPPC
ncbi:MAG: hypothetical protein LH618_16340, partial [Saprospiraceae bacterium]|nr:hypothetical protein [Saprospiraceae bacterium]